MRCILVTGDRGYIGSILVPLLLRQNYKVIGLDTDYFGNGKKNISYPNYKSITKDIRNIDQKDLRSVEAIIHLSALSNDPMGEFNPKLTEEINFRSSIKLAKLAKKLGVGRFLFSSSCSIYGIAIQGIVDEQSPVNPLTAYAKSKIDTERELLKLADSDFTVGIMRNSTVYGFSPKFRNDLVVNNLVTTALAFGEIRIMSDGTPWRPLIDVRDLSKIFIEFLICDSKKINGKIINVGFNENNLRVMDIVLMIKKHIPNCKVVYTGEHGKDTRSYRVNFDKFHKLFPQIDQVWTLEKSVQDMIKNLNKITFGRKEFESGKFTRLSTLKNLLLRQMIDPMLHWRRE